MSKLEPGFPADARTRICLKRNSFIAFCLLQTGPCNKTKVLGLIILQQTCILWLYLKTTMTYHLCLSTLTQLRIHTFRGDEIGSTYHILLWNPNKVHGPETLLGIISKFQEQLTNADPRQQDPACMDPNMGPPNSHKLSFSPSGWGTV